MKRSPIIVVLSLLPTIALAQGTNNYQCSLDELTRRVEIFYETGVTVPCEVHYYKDTEMPGERQVLWRAANEEGYCEARAAEFVAKLEGMGWTCWEGAEAPATDEEDMAEADDTDALAPAEEEIEIPEAEEDPR
jgi:hypothetical protein